MLTYDTYGHPAAPPVLLLHGLLGNRAEWGRVAELLVENGRQVVVPDQRGHGGADWADDYRADALVADVERLVAHLGWDGFDLVGHSLGGLVSLLYAASSPRVRTLTLVDIGPESLEDDADREGFLAVLASLTGTTYASPDELVEAWVAADPLCRRRETRRWAEHSLRRRPDGRWEWRTDVAHIGQFLRERPGSDRLRKAVAELTVPTLVVHGEDSWALPPAQARDLERRLADGHRVCVPGKCHDLGVQAPAEVAAAVAGFLADVDRRPVAATC